MALGPWVMSVYIDRSRYNEIVPKLCELVH